MTFTSNGTGKITIVAHSGGFHADDIFSVATLLLVLGDGVEVSIVRTRDMNIVEKGDYVVDVGGVYDVSTNRFDHHQIGGAGRRDNTIPYASFGLVWKTFGEKLSGSLEVANKIDKVLVQPVDAVDNGFQLVDTRVDGVRPFDIGEFFDAFSPTWKEEDKNVDDIFIQLVSYAKTILSREIVKCGDKIEASLIVEKTYRESEDKRLIVFDRHYPFREVLSRFPEPLFVVFPNENGDWVTYAIRDDENSFVYRKYLPESWAGKRDEELAKVTGVPDSVFCHNGRFIAVARGKDSALRLAELALNQ